MLSEPLKPVSEAASDGLYQLLMRLPASLQAITGSRRKLPWRYRWPDAVCDEVLARLLALNAARHEQEVNLGMQGAGKKTPMPRTKPKSNGNAAQPAAFELTGEPNRALTTLVDGVCQGG